jgi:uncharacterized DUF497 family protein
LLLRITFDLRNLSKHDVSREEVLEVFDCTVNFTDDLMPSKRGNDRRLIVGWTDRGRILEVGVEYFDYENREHVFHARDARKKLQQRFVRRLRYGY